MELSKPLDITPSEVKLLTKRYFLEKCDNNLEVVSYSVRSVSESPQGFLGKHQYLDILVKKYSGSNTSEHKLRLFLKTAPVEVAALMNYLDEFKVFEKECNIYKCIFPRMLDINVGVPYFAPKCYLVKENFLVFENLADQSFKLGASRDGILDYDHLNCGLRTLANFHSASIVLENRNNKRMPEMYKNCLEENAYPDNPNSIRLRGFQKAVESLSELIKMIPKYANSPNLSGIIKGFATEMSKIFDLVKTSSKYRNVICHGDLWANNLMFRYDSNKMPIACKLVDFQLGRYAPPMLDVITLLTIPTTTDFRTRYLSSLLDNYYHFMTEFLTTHSIDIEEIIPKQEYHETINYFKLVGLIESCLFSHLTILPPSVTTDICNNSDQFDDFLTKHRSKVCIKAFQVDTIYSERLTDMISDIIENFVLGNYS